MAEVIEALDSNLEGISSASAGERLTRFGRNSVDSGQNRRRALRMFLDRFRSPLVLILVFAALVALVVHDWLDAAIILAIVLASAVLGHVQEYRAMNAVRALRLRVSIKASVRRDGQVVSIPAEEVIPGDVVLLSAGSLIPADGLILTAKDFYVSQATLTGETFPVDKQPGIVPPEAVLAERSNCVFMGTSVRSGTANALIVTTGRKTHFGEIADKLARRPEETEFERGLRRFGTMLMRVMITVVLCVLVVNITLHHSTLETVLFAMALAVGLSPEMLPAILQITLARGASELARLGVIVKRLNAIENLGGMDVLCTDKTGTLTRGVVQLDRILDVEGQPSASVLGLAYDNARLQSGIANPLDEAIAAAGRDADIDCSQRVKVDEIPYDFVRKRLSVVVNSQDEGTLLITKGSVQTVLDVCELMSSGDTHVSLDAQSRATLLDRFAGWSKEGYRVLGVASRIVQPNAAYTRLDECSMVFEGFLLFFDPPEDGIRKTLATLSSLGVSVKIITGDNRFIASHVAGAIGIEAESVITGEELSIMSDEALWHSAPLTSVFAEVDPNQKERIIAALQHSNHVVGFIGDGINDAPALYAADVGISVDQAADVAKEASDLVLLKHDLSVVANGITEGRRTFANTLKYIFITTSANFGNMISMACASLFLPFLPLMAKQILLNNFLSDIPAIGIAGDRVNENWGSTPHRWDIRLITRFMLTFGLISTAFDLVTFAALLSLVGDTPELFRTGWFVESLLTELVVLLVFRTTGPFWKSRPSPFLAWSIGAMVLVTFALPYMTIGSVFGFVPLPLPVMLTIVIIAITYIAASELAKYLFFRKLSEQQF